MTRPKRGVGLVLYGDPGIGKTSLAAQFPKPIRGVSCNDEGFADLIDSGQIDEGMIEEETVSSYTELMNLTKQSDDVATYVVDGITGVTQFMGADILKKNYGGNIENFGSFSSGWRIEGPIWTERFLNQCTLLRNKGVNVILLGHKRVGTEDNVISTNYKSASINTEKWMKPLYVQWAQATLYLTMDFDIRITKTWKKKATEAKVDEDLDSPISRVMYTDMHPSHDAKNRLGLPVSISMGDSAKEAYYNLVSNFPPRIQESLNFIPNKD